MSLVFSIQRRRFDLELQGLKVNPCGGIERWGRLPLPIGLIIGLLSPFGRGNFAEPGTEK